MNTEPRSSWRARLGWGALAALVVVACATETVEPYPYEDDDDAGMYQPDGRPVDGGSDDGGGTGSSYDGLEGDWKGTCSVDLYGYGYDFGLGLGIEEDDGTNLTGRGALTLYGYAYTGDMSGEKSGDAVGLFFQAESSGYPIPVTLAGDVEGDQITGSCTVIYYSGTFEVERE